MNDTVHSDDLTVYTLHGEHSFIHTKRFAATITVLLLLVLLVCCFDGACALFLPFFANRFDTVSIDTKITVARA